MDRTPWIVGGVVAALIFFARRRVLMWPVEGIITTLFHDPERPTHNGIDIAVPVGTPVRAPGSGTVFSTYTDDAGGRSLVMDLDSGLRAGFAHLSEWIAAPGQRVTRGDVIAKSGNTGSHTTGPHLHFTLRRGTERIDPLPFLP